MPVEWYVYSENCVKDDDDPDTQSRKLFNQKICAHKKPYFFGYNYTSLMQEHRQKIEEINSKLLGLMDTDLDGLMRKSNKTEEEERLLDIFLSKLPLDLSPSTMNRICWSVERHFSEDVKTEKVPFDYTIYKSGVEYTASTKQAVYELVRSYLSSLKSINKQKAKFNESDTALEKAQVLRCLVEECHAVVPSEVMLCDILLDLCYSDGVSKAVVWDVCGEQIFQNMLRKHGYRLKYPMRVPNGDFVCKGYQFSECEMVVE